VSHAADNPVFCARKDDLGCPARTPDSRFHRIRAGEAGWFFSRETEEAYCPEHVPGWVPAWRARKAVEKFEVQSSFTRQPAVSRCADCDFSEVEDEAATGVPEVLKAQRARGFEHARRTGHTVTITASQVLTIEPARATADA
jgi:hypothetical protein